MKEKLALLIAVSFLTSAIIAQGPKRLGFAPGQKKPDLFGIAFTLTDFNAPKNFNTGNGVSLPVKDMSAGVSLTYWKGLTPFIDFSASIHGIFHDYSALYFNTPGKTEIGLELEPTINIRPVKDENMWAPFLTVGLGGGLYTNHMGAYVPLGGGLQFNASTVTYFFLQAQYKWSISPNVIGNNLFYSLGFAQNIGGDQRSAAKASLPTVPAIEVAKDIDKDGVRDEADACPEITGVAALKGCPDMDADGIADKDDKCPGERGLIKYGGCPVPDTDKDGINDEDDKCTSISGVARYQGCPVPDTDKDGINDEEDKCPTVAGVASNMGCREIPATIINKINKAAENIFFATASSTLLPASSVALDAIVAILKTNKDYKIEISGYTDNQGDALRNQALSEARATAVKTYLTSKGIQAGRLNAEGYGDDNPKADNNTAEGRAKNRRVELRIRNY
jgi:OOP family OmpA-OmpF porin